MNNHSYRAISLFSHASLVAFLAVFAGCDTGQDTDDSTAPVNDPATRLTETEEVDDVGGNSSTATDASTQRSSERNQSSSGTNDGAAANERNVAVAYINPTVHGDVTGTVTFSPSEDAQGIWVSIELAGLSSGRHGFHIHEVGDCSADDASSAGGHFSPNDEPHGSPADANHHVGDMGNLEADNNGQVSHQLRLDGLSFSGPASILNRAVVIHQTADDLESQPSGDSGQRIGCGVIRAG